MTSSLLFYQYRKIRYSSVGVLYWIIFQFLLQTPGFGRILKFSDAPEITSHGPINMQASHLLLFVEQLSDGGPGMQRYKQSYFAYTQWPMSHVPAQLTAVKKQNKTHREYLVSRFGVESTERDYLRSVQLQICVCNTGLRALASRNNAQYARVMMTWVRAAPLTARQRSSKYQHGARLRRLVTPM